MCGGFDSFELYKLTPPGTEECSTPAEAYEQVTMLFDSAAPCGGTVVYYSLKSLVLIQKLSRFLPLYPA